MAEIEFLGKSIEFRENPLSFGKMPLFFELSVRYFGSEYKICLATRINGTYTERTCTFHFHLSFSYLFDVTKNLTLGL